MGMVENEIAVSVKVKDSKIFKEWLERLTVTLEEIESSMKKFKHDYPDLYDNYFGGINLDLDLNNETKTKPQGKKNNRVKKSGGEAV